VQEAALLVVENCPAPHAKQVFERELLYNPSTQWVHDDADAAENVPALQSAQLLAPADE